MTRRRRFIFTLVLAAICAGPAVAFAKPPATTAPSRVSLKVDRVPATQAVAELFKQADVHLVASPHFAELLANTTVTIDRKDDSFLMTAIDLFRQCGMQPEQSPTAGAPTAYQLRPLPGHPPVRVNASVANGMQLLPASPSWLDAPPIEAGPFVLVPSHAHRQSEINLESPGAPSRSLDVYFRVLRDPRVRLWGIADRLDVIEATDEAGKSLRSLKPGESPQAKPLTNETNSIWTVSAKLDYPVASKKLGSLKATLRATLVTKSTPIELLDPLGRRPLDEQKSDNFRVAVKSFEVEGDGSVLQMTLHYAEPPPSTGEVFGPIRPLVHRDQFTIRGAAGELYFVEPNITAFRENHFYDVTLRLRPYQAFRDDPKSPPRPMKITWNVPLEVEDVAVPIEVKDLLLP